MDQKRILQEMEAEIARVEGYLKHLKLAYGALTLEGEELKRFKQFLGGPSRRGRKSMGPTERKEVSTRMKRYWADRHKTEMTPAEVEQRMRTM